MITLTIALFLTYAVAFLLGAAERAKDKAREQAEFDRHSTDALAMVAEAGSRNRHPSAR